MRMSRYLTALGVTALVSFALIWGWIIAVPLAFLDPEYPAWLAKQRLLQGCDLGDLIVVGNSRAAVDIMPALLSVPSTNLAVGGGSPIEAYAVVRQALACAEPPRRVIISFDAAHFSEPDLFWERSVRFGFIGNDLLRDLRRVSLELGDTSIWELRRDGVPPALRGGLYAMRFPSLYFSSLLKGGVFLRWWHNREFLAQTIAARGQYFFGTDPGSSGIAVEGHLTAFTPLPVLDHYFAATLALLAERGVDVEFVAMPMNEATWHATRPALRSGFAAYLTAYATRYANLHIAGDVMPHWPDRWFGDAFSHLNPEGARRFSTDFALWLSTAARRSPEHAERGAIGMIQ